LERGSTVPKRCGNSRPHRVLRRNTNRFHGRVIKSRKPLPPRSIVVFVDNTGLSQRSGHKPPKFHFGGNCSDADASRIWLSHCSKRAVGWIKRNQTASQPG
jgi:hypothetical protein